MKENRWELFFISLGFLFIATSPNMDNPKVNLIMGSLIVILGFILLRRNRKVWLNDKISKRILLW